MLFFRSVAVAILLSVSVCVQAAPLLEPIVGPAGSDVGKEFQELFAGRLLVTKASLEPYKIVFIPGFNADFIDDTVGYFQEARRELRKLGLREGVDFELLKHQSGFSGEDSMSSNSEALARYLRASEKPVLAISHSKGAVDLLEALLQHPELRAKVKGWFSVQGAFGGSILADVFSKGWTRPIVKVFLAGYGGSIEALEDLRRPQREVYLRTHLPEIDGLMRDVPMVSFVTRQEYSHLSAGLKTLVLLFDPEYERSQSDGMVEIHNALLAYSPYVFLEGFDHRDCAETGDFDRVRFTHASLQMLLSRIKP